MSNCEVCGKTTALHYHFCAKCNEKIKNGQIEKCQHCGVWKETNRKCDKCGFPFLENKKHCPYQNCKEEVKKCFGKEIKFASREEAKIAKFIENSGYHFDHDQMYPFENMGSKRYDFHLLTNTGTDFKKQIFIEVKCHNPNKYIDQMLEKQRLCLENGAEFIFLDEATENEFNEKLEKTINRIMN
jgi:hypothetical protein